MSDIKNIDDILLSDDQIRGERIDAKDKALFFFGSHAQTKFGFSTSDTVEFSVFDTENNLLHWENKGIGTFDVARGISGVDSLILKPGEDMRNAGFSLGQYRVGYAFYNNALGAALGNKVYIHEISPSRKEVRLLPVKTGDGFNDGDFSLDFEDFTEKLIQGEDFIRLTFDNVNNAPAFDEFNANYERLEERIFDLEDRLAQARTQGLPKGNPLELELQNLQTAAARIAGTTGINEAIFRNYFGQFTNAFNLHHEKYVKSTSVPPVLSPRERDILLQGICSEAVDMVLGLLYDYAAPSNDLSNYCKERLFDIANVDDDEIDDSFRYLKYVLNFGNSDTFLIVNWVRDDIEFSNAPYAIIAKLLDPLPDDFEENDQLWISRELSPPVFEKVFLQGVEEEIEDGRELRPPNFNIDVDKLGRRSTPFESFDDLVSTHATTSQQLIDHYFSGSLEGEAKINVDYTDYSNFVHFGTATERLANFKYKLEVIEDYDSQLVSLYTITGSASRSLNVLHDIDRLESKKNSLIGGFDGYEKYLYTVSGSHYSASVPVSESVPYNSIGEWPKQDKYYPYTVYSVTASEAIDWFDTQEALALAYDRDNLNSLIKNTPEHILVDDKNASYVLFVEMIGQYFDIFHSYIKALGLIHNRDEDILTGLSKDLTFNIAKSLGFDLENGNDYKELWESAFGFNVSGTLNQTGDIVAGWVNTGDTFETFETSSTNPLDITSAINSAGNGNFRSNTTVDLPLGVEFTVMFELSGSLSGNNFFKISSGTPLNNAVFDQALVTGSNEFTITPTENWVGFYAGVRTTGTSTDYSITNFSMRPTDGNVQSMPTTDVTKEIWRRILNNLPYLLKTKGTARSVKALLACYGIPNSLLAIREYGGPDPSEFPRLQDRSSFVFEDFIYSIVFKGDQAVYTDWQDFGDYTEKPSTVELTFKTDQSSIPTQSLLNVSNNWGISLRQTGSLYGKPQGMVVFEIDGTEISSSVFDFYNDDFYTVVLTTDKSTSDYTHSLYVKHAEGTRLTYQSSASLIGTSVGVNWEADTTLALGSGSTYGDFFSGSMKEFRLFQPMLSESVFDNHVRWPQSFNTNGATGSYDDMVLRYSFDDPKNHDVTSIVDDVKPNQDFTNDGTAQGFADEQNYSPTTIEFAGLATNFAGNRFINNKLRIEDNSLVFGNLDTTQRMEVSSFDFAPLDSNRLGIYFSPIDTINKDILATFGGVDISGVLGQPSDVFSGSYTGLKELQDYYFQKFTSPLDYNAFIRFLKRYDLTLFQQLKSLLPARADSTVGVLIEPHILERNKEITLRPIQAPIQLEKTASINGIIQRDHSASINFYESEVLNASSSYDISSDTLEKDPVILVVTNDSASDYSAGNAWQNQGVIDVILPVEEYDDTWFCKNRDWAASQKSKFRGILNTKETSFEQQDVIQTFFTNPNILKTTDEGPSKLKVE